MSRDNPDVPRISDFQITDVGKSKLLFFFMGLINSAGKVFLVNAASDIAQLTGKKSYMSAVSGALVGLSCLIKIFNARYIVRFKHRTRILGAVFFFVIGIVIILLALNILNFWLALAGCLVVGIGTSLSDTTLQGFMKVFDPRIVVGWSMGTGLAGLFCSTYFNILTSLGVNLYISLSTLFPLYLIYYIGFEVLMKERRSQILLNGFTLEDAERREIRDVQTNKQLDMSTLPVFWSKMSYYVLNNLVVYFVVYSMISYQADIMREKFNDALVFRMIINLYQLGAFIGRASINYFSVEKLYFQTFIVMGFYLFWTCLALFFQSFSVYLLYALIIVIGLTCGSSYGSIIVNIMKDKSITKQEKEACVNLNSAAADLGVLCSSAAGIIVEKVLF